MEGSRRGWLPPLEVRREFAGSRLEEQILVRTYELVVPVIRRCLDAQRHPTAVVGHEPSQRLKEGV